MHSRSIVSTQVNEPARRASGLGRRDMLKLVAAPAVASVALAAPIVEARAASNTFVLVHGSWCGGWIWRRVTDRLHAAGHVAFAPTHTGLGERAHLMSREISIDTFIQDIVNVIEAEELTDVVLVGHSSGGIPITGVADRIPERLRHLVYLDTGIVENGKSFFDLALPEAVAARTKAAQDFDGGMSVPTPAANGFGLTDPADIAWLERRFTPHPLKTYSTPLRLNGPIGNGLPKTYISCVNPMFPGSNRAREWAKQQSDWKYVELNSGHAAPVMAPDLLTQMLIGIAAS